MTDSLEQKLDGWLFAVEANGQKIESETHRNPSNILNSMSVPEAKKQILSLIQQVKDQAEARWRLRRGQLADLEVIEAILLSDPRERASGYDAEPKAMAEAIRVIIEDHVLKQKTKNTTKEGE